MPAPHWLPCAAVGHCKVWLTHACSALVVSQFLKLANLPLVSTKVRVPCMVIAREALMMGQQHCSQACVPPASESRVC